MSTNNYKTCGFAEELISHVYGENNLQDSDRFENHLEGCRACREELSAFGFVRTTLNTWRDSEFANIETPVISIPQMDSRGISAARDLKETPSIISRLREMFTIVPSWAAAASVAVLLIGFVGVAIFLVSSSQPVDVSEKENLEQLLMPPQEPPNESKVDNKLPNLQPENQVIADSMPNAIDEIDKEPKKAERVVLTKKPHNLQKKDQPSLQSNKPSVNQVANSNSGDKLNKPKTPELNEIPKLTNFTAEEDDSLRLADLFDSIGSK